jgi:hypothetical protein
MIDVSRHSPYTRSVLSVQGTVSVATMERTMWSDARLDERFDAIDRRFDAVDRRLDRIEEDIRDLRQLMFQLWGTNMLAILVTIAVVLATRA